MSISLPPSKKIPNEKVIEAIINKGGAPTKAKAQPEDQGSTKSIKLILTTEEMETIKRLRDKRPAPRGRKLAMSVHDWVIEAIQEKIERESRKYDRL